MNITTHAFYSKVVEQTSSENCSKKSIRKCSEKVVKQNKMLPISESNIDLIHLCSLIIRFEITDWKHRKERYMIIERVMQTHKFDLIHNSVWSFLKLFPFCINPTQLKVLLIILKAYPQTIEYFVIVRRHHVNFTCESLEAVLSQNLSVRYEFVRKGLRLVTSLLPVMRSSESEIFS